MQYRQLQTGGEMMKNALRPALTMLELILVIVILGIVASVGAEIIANVYQSYIIQRAQHRASIKTELAALQIANRLAYAIPGTVVRKKNLNAGGKDITQVAPSDYNVLQWVGADADSFKAFTAASQRPGWSGYCDINSSPVGGNTISTPGSNLNLADTIIQNLSKNNAGAVTKRIANAQIFFPLQDNTVSYGSGADKVFLPLASYGVSSASTGESITLNSNLAATDHISEHYKLAWTSYALEAKTNGDLVLHYNFTPRRGVQINGSSQRLLRNVTTFRFRGDGRTIRFKICVRENIGDDNITICKEKAVF